MHLKHLINEKQLDEILKEAKSILLTSNKIKFRRESAWQKSEAPNFPGVYILYEDNNMLYIGESGNLRERMADICRTVNHTFRRQLECKLYGIKKGKKKFDADIEILLNTYFDEKLKVSFIEISFGRVEIETYLVSKYQSHLLNSEKKRKLSSAN